MRRGVICASASACKASFERKKTRHILQTAIEKVQLKNAESAGKRTVTRKMSNDYQKINEPFIEKTGRMCYFI